MEVSDYQSVLALSLEQKKNMIATANPEQTIGQRSEMSLQRQWPQLGRELFTLESALTGTVIAKEFEGTITEQIEQIEKLLGAVPGRTEEK